MQLRELLTAIDFLEIEGSTALEIAGISHQARRVLPGDLFVALQYEGAECSSETELAIARGASAVICRRNGTLRRGVTRIEVQDTRFALAQAAARFYGHPGENLHVIGVTGTNAWKTAWLTRQILQNAGVATALISSLRHEIGKRILPSNQAVEASDTQRLLAASRRAGCSACVVELRGISPTALSGLPVNVLVYGGGEQNLRALSHFVRSRPASPVCGIVNVDDESGRNAASSNIFKMLLTCGFSVDAEVRAENPSFSPSGTQFFLELSGSSAVCDLSLIGRENLRHLLSAAGACLSAISPAETLRAMRQIKTPPGCLEAVPNTQDLSVYVDGARTADELSAVLAELKRFCRRRVLLAFGCAQGTTGKERYEVGLVAGQCADHVILTSDNPGVERVEDICATIAQGVESGNRSRYHLQPDRTQAIRELITMAEPGDVVLIAGKGARTHQLVTKTIIPFDDSEIASESLKNLVRSPARPAVARAVVAA